MNAKKPRQFYRLECELNPVEDGLRYSGTITLEGRKFPYDLNFSKNLADFISEQRFPGMEDAQAKFYNPDSTSVNWREDSRKFLTAIVAYLATVFNRPPRPEARQARDGAFIAFREQYGRITMEKGKKANLVYEIPRIKSLDRILSE